VDVAVFVGDTDAIGVDVEVPVEVLVDVPVDVPVDELDGIAPALSWPRFAFTPQAA
jgi:hypothetical protein